MDNKNKLESMVYHENAPLVIHFRDKTYNSQKIFYIISSNDFVNESYVNLFKLNSELLKLL